MLFRLDAEVLEKLDRKISREGFKTRNKWFRDMVEEFLDDQRKVRPMERRT